MYKIEIKKSEKRPNVTVNNGIYYFNLAELHSALDPTIKTSIFTEFKKCNIALTPIAEDLLTFALSIYAIDKRFPRSNANDAWTREFSVSIPVCEIEKWIQVVAKIEAMLCFLSGDIWHIEFVYTDNRIVGTTQRAVKMRTDFDCICLFSGGLDSFCGAIKLLEENKKVLFIGNEEYPKLKERQEKLINILRGDYNQGTFEIKTFTSQIQSYIFNGEMSKSTENTTRTRSLLFLAAAISYSTLMQQTDIPVYIPENGFIGLNLPLTPSRMGTCSTRTTHPKFLRMLNEILSLVGFRTVVENPFKFLAKSDVVKAVENTNAFKQGAALTISCSHPTIGRYIAGGSYPNNCGYCYPCLIRKSSLMHLNLAEHYDVDLNTSFFGMSANKQDDIRSMLFAARQYKLYGREHIVKRIIAEGNLDSNEIEPFAELYVKTIQDFISIISDQSLKTYAGIQNATI